MIEEGEMTTENVDKDTESLDDDKIGLLEDSSVDGVRLLVLSSGLWLISIVQILLCIALFALHTPCYIVQVIVWPSSMLFIIQFKILV